MRKYRAIAFSALIGAALAQSHAVAQDSDDDHDGAAAGGAATEQATRASKNVPELILGSADDQFTVNQKDFELIAGQGYRWKINRRPAWNTSFTPTFFAMSG